MFNPRPLDCDSNSLTAVTSKPPCISFHTLHSHQHFSKEQCTNTQNSDGVQNTELVHRESSIDNQLRTRTLKQPIRSSYRQCIVAITTGPSAAMQIEGTAIKIYKKEQHKRERSSRRNNRNYYTKLAYLITLLHICSIQLQYSISYSRPSDYLPAASSAHSQPKMLFEVRNIHNSSFGDQFISVAGHFIDRVGTFFCRCGEFTFVTKCLHL